MGTGNLPKTWTDEENLTNEALNENFQYLLDQQSTSGTDGLSEDVNEMQLQTSPGDLGSESLATSLKGEIERIRFQLSQIIGEQFWYQQPAISLKTLAGSFGMQSYQNRIISGAVRSGGMPIFLKAPSSGLNITLEASVTPFSAYIKGKQFTQDSDLSVAMVAAPSSNNTALINDSSLNGSAPTKSLGSIVSIAGTSYAIECDTVGSEIQLMIGKVASFKTPGNELFTTFLKKATSGQAIMIDCKRGFFFDSNSAPIKAAGISNNDSLTLLRTAWVFYRNDGTNASIFVCYNAPSYGAVTPSSITIGDMWLDTESNVWKRFDGTSFVDYDCTYIGIAVADSANVIGTRSVEFFSSYASFNSSFVGSNEDSTKVFISPGSQISVSGKAIQIQSSGKLLSQTDVEPDSGSIPNGTPTPVFVYIFANGQCYLSTIPPIHRPDMLGFYHPYANARCIAFCGWDTNISNKFGSFVSESGVRNISLVQVSPYNASFNNSWQNVMSAKLFWTGKKININFLNGNSTTASGFRFSASSGAMSCIVRVKIESVENGSEIANFCQPLTFSPALTTVQIPMSSFNTIYDSFFSGAESTDEVNPMSLIRVSLQVFSANTDSGAFLENCIMVVSEDIGRAF